MSELRSSVFSSQRLGSSRRRRGPRPAAVVLVGLLVLVVAELVTLWIHTSRHLEPTTVPALAEVPSGASEQRGGETLVVVTAPDDGGQRVVSVMIAQVHPDRSGPVALVLPVGLEIAAPGHGDLPLGAVLGTGGPDLLVRAVQDYTGIDIEHIAVIDADGVADMAAEQGGVDLCAIVASANCKQSRRDVVLDQLSEVANGDDIALARQQFSVIQAVLAKAGGRLDILLHPFRTAGTASAAGRALLTDVDLGGRSALGWAGRVGSEDTSSVLFVTLPGFRDPATGAIQTFVEQAEGVLQAMREGTAFPEGATAGPAELSPSEVSVSVRNGSGVDGLANSVADKLSAAGFNVVDVGNASSFDVPTTAIDFGPGLRPLAELALEHVPGAVLRESGQTLFQQGTAVDLIITIGTDFAGGPAQPSPTPSPT